MLVAAVAVDVGRREGSVGCGGVGGGAGGSSCAGGVRVAVVMHGWGDADAWDGHHCAYDGDDDDDDNGDR